jgi:hypothetical protein
MTLAAALAAIAPFDYSAKFSSCGASLYEPGSDDDAQVDEMYGGHSVTSAGSGGRSSNGANKNKHAGGGSGGSVSSFHSGGGGSSSKKVRKNNNSGGGCDDHSVSKQYSAITSGGSVMSERDGSRPRLRSNVMIVKEKASFSLKERVPLGQQVYRSKGTLTLYVGADNMIRKIELFNAFDTSMHY